MGNKLSCCWKPKASRRRGRDSKSVHPAPESGDHDREAGRADGDFEFLDSMFTKGVPVLRLSDLQLPEGLIPSDHPEACTIFLKKSQVDVRGKRKSSCYSYHVSPDHLMKKYSSCATLYVDSTISQSDLRLTVQCLALAIYHHIKNRDANRSKDIFDERIHPFTQNTAQEEHFTTVQEEHFTHNPDPESIYRFIHPFFISISVTAGYAISTLVYIERLLTYAEIDICPTNWKRIVFGAIVLAFKYWHDLDISNSIFCQICKGITAKDLSELEREYFYLLQFSLNVSLSVYAKYYFDLRALASDHGLLPIAFAPLGKERALNLECLRQAMNIWFLLGIENINETEDSTEPLIDPVYEQGRATTNLVAFQILAKTVMHTYQVKVVCNLREFNNYGQYLMSLKLDIKNNYLNNKFDIPCIFTPNDGLKLELQKSLKGFCNCIFVKKEALLDEKMAYNFPK